MAKAVEKGVSVITQLTKRTGFGIPHPIKKEYEIKLMKYGVPSPNTAGAKGNHPLRAETNSSVWSNQSRVRSRQRASGRGLAGKRKVCSARVSVCRRCRRCRHRSTSRGWESAPVTHLFLTLRRPDVHTQLGVHHEATSPSAAGVTSRGGRAWGRSRTPRLLTRPSGVWVEPAN